MLEIGEKVFMNIQEAVGWLLKNNALPFQSTANYVADTEIAKSTIVNPSPAEVKVGSLVLFADSKVGTVSGLTSNGFMVSSEYTDIQLALAYIASVTINASQHLITTLSDGTVKDAGLIKMISSMSINASQHLIANYNDGTTNDLGAIFLGNVNIAGNLTADSIIENMSGYAMTQQTLTNATFTPIYGSVVKNGNKLTIAYAFNYKRTGTVPLGVAVAVAIPSAIGSKIYVNVGLNTVLKTSAYAIDINGPSDLEVAMSLYKYSNTYLGIVLAGRNDLTENVDYYIRFECTLLLSDNMLA